MSKIQLRDFHHWENLRPFTFTRSIADIRLGIYTIREKWEKILNDGVSVKTRSHLQPLYGSISSFDIEVNSAVLPNIEMTNEILALQKGESLWSKDIWIASFGEENLNDKKELPKGIDCNVLCYPEDIFLQAGNEIRKDILLSGVVTDQSLISETNTIIGDHEVFVEKGATMECCTLNTQDGPIYIGKGAHVMEGSILRGPISIGHDSVIKMGARIYSNTSIGPWCKVGGEIKNSVFLGYSNKAHEGYMGNSVIGEWCNWGADTNNSNMKNNYSTVKLWDYNQDGFRNTGHQFVGLMMGDHSKTGINTMFNTGTVIGVSCNIYGTGFPRKFIPSYSWGGVHGFKTYNFNKAIETAQAMQKRRDIDLPQTEIDMLSHVFEESGKYRMWEKQ